MNGEGAKESISFAPFCWAPGPVRSSARSTAVETREASVRPSAILSWAM
jgi:hypothetical protein